MRKVKTNYDHLPQAEFDEKVGYIIFMCNNNPYFTNLPFPVADMIIKRTDWQGKLNKSKAGDHVATEEARTTQVELSAEIKKNGNYINDVANGDVAKLESSGYDLVKERVMGPVDEVRVIQGDQSGSGKVIIEAVEGAKGYLIFHRADPGTEAFDEKKCTRLPMTTKHYQNISGVVSGQQWGIYYCTVSTEGESVVKGPFLFKLI
jgi:hypothetical protein